MSTAECDPPSPPPIPPKKITEHFLLVTREKHVPRESGSCKEALKESDFSKEHGASGFFFYFYF